MSLNTDVTLVIHDCARNDELASLVSDFSECASSNTPANHPLTPNGLTLPRDNDILYAAPVWTGQYNYLDVDAFVKHLRRVSAKGESSDSWVVAISEETLDNVLVFMKSGTVTL